MQADEKWNGTSQTVATQLANGFQAARRGEPKDDSQGGAWLDGYELSDAPAPTISTLGGDPALAERGAVAEAALDRMFSSSVAPSFPPQQWAARVAVDRERWVLEDAGMAPSRTVYQHDPMDRVHRSQDEFEDYLRCPEIGRAPFP